jgi:hypothetical protein
VLGNHVSITVIASYDHNFRLFKLSYKNPALFSKFRKDPQAVALALLRHYVQTNPEEAGKFPPVLEEFSRKPRINDLYAGLSLMEAAYVSVFAPLPK